MGFNGNCFICESSTVSSPTLEEINSNESCGGSGGDCDTEVEDSRGSDLNTVFVLTKVFQVPAQVLSEHWPVATGDPNALGKVVLCGRCFELVKNANKIYNSLLEAVRAFRKVQCELVHLTKSQRRKVARKEVDPVRKWRRFIETHDYGSNGDPFLVEEHLSLLTPVEVKEELEEDPMSPLMNEDEPENILEPGINGMSLSPVSGREDDDSEDIREEDKQEFEDDNEGTHEEEDDGVSSDSEEEEEKEEYKPKKRGPYKRKSVPTTSSQLAAHPCPIQGCSKSFKARNSLARHVNSQHKMGLKCKLCSKSFSEKSELDKHATSEHHELTCPMCHRLCSNSRGLKFHLRAAHKVMGEFGRKRDFVCTEADCNCGKVFRTGENLRVHLSRVRGTPHYKCRHCDKRLYSFQERQRHEDREHSGGEQFICENCGKRFVCKQYMLAHIGTEHLGKAYGPGKTPKKICHLCGKEFFSKHGLDLHVKTIHEGQRFHFCSECGKGFAKQIECQRHMYTQHGIGDESVKQRDASSSDARCTVVGCRKPFWGENAEEKLKKHVESEHGESGNEKRFKCTLCEKEFVHPWKLKEHLTWHENKETKPFKCETCGKGFAIKSYLRLHELTIHNAERMFRRKKETRPRSVLGTRKKEKNVGAVKMELGSEDGIGQ